MGIATRHISPQIALSAVLFIGLAAIAYHALNDQLLKAFLVVLIPIAIIYIILSIKRPLIALITYGTLCYFWGVIYRTFIRVNGISILLDIGMLFFAILHDIAFPLFQRHQVETFFQCGYGSLRYLVCLLFSGNSQSQRIDRGMGKLQSHVSCHTDIHHPADSFLYAF